MARFISRYLNHTLVMEPAHRFERDGKVVSKAGRRIEFQEGRYETVDREEVEFLRGHRDFGLFIFEEHPTAVGGGDVNQNETYGGGGDAEEASYTCKTCGETFDNKGQYLAHCRGHKKAAS